MTHPFVSLLRITFRNYYGISLIRRKYLHEKKGLWRLAIVGIAGGISCLLLFALSFVLSAGFFAAGSMLHAPALVLEIAFASTLLVVFIFGLSSTISTLYYTQDTAFLASLPLQPYQLLAAKFALILSGEYLVQFFFLAPPLIVYGTGEGRGLLYILAACLVFLLFPVLPLAPAAAIAVAIMSRAGSKRVKDGVTVLVYVMLITFGIGMQFFAQGLPKGQELAALQQLIAAHGSLLNLVGRGFPPILWSARALSQTGSWDGLFNLILLILLAIVLLFLLLLIGERYFYGGLLAGEEVGRTRHCHHRKVETVWHAQSPVQSLLAREHRLFMRTPVYVLNVLPVAVIVPLVLVLPLIAQDRTGEITALAPFLAAHPYLKLLIAAITIFIGTTSLAPTAISREGRPFVLSQMLPVAPSVQVMVKFWYIIIVNSLCSLPFFLLAVMLCQLPWTDILILAILSSLGTSIMTSLGMMIDLLHPHLDWDNPQRAVKSNLNVLFAMLSSGLLLLLLAGLDFLLTLALPWQFGCLLLALLLAGVATILYRQQLSMAEKIFKALEL